MSARHRLEGGLPEDALADDEWVTQFVFYDASPQNWPRPRDKDGLSVLRGQLDVDEAAYYVRLQVHEPYEGDSVRHTTVGNLRAAGFEVLLTPSRRIPIHVSVSREAEWVENDRHRFDECFSDQLPRKAVSNE